MKIKNANHYTEEQEDILHDIFNYANAEAEECKRIYFDGSLTKQDKYTMISAKTTGVAAILNMLSNKFKYEVRNDNNFLMSQEIFNKAHYYEMNAKVEVMKEQH